MDVRELRLAVEAKLNDRRRLLTENAGLRQGIRQERAKNDFMLEVLKSPLVNMEMERCADEIVNAVLDEALKASKAIAEQTMDKGDYVVGINIPSLHIRRHLSRLDVRGCVGGPDYVDLPIKRATYNGK